jgi:hypothetical protein
MLRYKFVVNRLHKLHKYDNVGQLAGSVLSSYVYDLPMQDSWETRLWPKQ